MCFCDMVQKHFKYSYPISNLDQEKFMKGNFKPIAKQRNIQETLLDSTLTKDSHIPMQSDFTKQGINLP